MLTDTAFLDDAQSLGAIPCESLSSEPCWANMNTLSSGGGGGGSGGSSNSNSPGNNNNTTSSSPTSNNNSGSGSSGGGSGGAGLHGTSASAGAIKKRRKSDTKPLSQINKCLNEKRRREQENVYIEELAELISVSPDVNSLSVKPDKCAILQETVNQIRRIREQEEDGRSSSSSSSTSSSSSASAGNNTTSPTAATDGGVQQGDVSSSKPALLDTQLLGTFLLEALDGFLFVVNTEGKTEYVSENVAHFLHYQPQDLVGKSIYNFIHHGDHARFSSSLLPTAIAWPSEMAPTSQNRLGRCFNCRLLIQPLGEQDETMEEKQQRVEHYENMQISSVLQPYPVDSGRQNKQPNKNSGVAAAAAAAIGLEASDLEMALTSVASGSNGGDPQHCLVCVARRIPSTEKMASAAMVATGGPVVEQFTTKLDSTGKIVAVDVTGVSPPYSSYFNKDTLISCTIQELCHPDDLSIFQAHFQETLQSGCGLSSRYRIRLAAAGGAASLIVQTKSKRFVHSDTHDTDFVMATHSIIVDDDDVAGDNNSASRIMSSKSDNLKDVHQQMSDAANMSQQQGNPVLTSVVRHDVISASSFANNNGRSGTSSYSSTFAGLSLGTSGDLLNDFVVPDLFMASPPWGGDFNNSESSMDATSAAAQINNSNHLPALGNQQLSAPSPLSLGPSGGPLLAGHIPHSIGGMINWGSPPPSTVAGGGGQRPPVSSRPSSRQSASSTPRPPSVSSAFSPAPNSVLGVVHPSPVLSPVGATLNTMAMSCTSVGSATASSSSAGQQQPSPASMTTPFSNNFPFSPLQDPIPQHPATAPTCLNNPSTPYSDDVRDSKEGILSSGNHYPHHGPDKQVSTLSNLLNSGDAATSSSSSSSSSSSVTESGRLRILLMQRPANAPAALNQQPSGHVNNSMNGSHLLASLGESSDGVKREKEDNSGISCGLLSGSKGSHDNRILKGLLNQDDGDETDQSDEANNHRFLLTARGNSCAEPVKNGSNNNNNNNSNNNNNNNMLHKLLNVRSDDDAEQRMGLRKPNELLKKLLKESDEDQASGSSSACGGAAIGNNQQQLHQQHPDQVSFQEEQLLKSLGFPSPTSSSGSTPTVTTGSLANMLSTSQTTHLKSPPPGCDGLLEFGAVVCSSTAVFGGNGASSVAVATRGTKRHSEEARDEGKASKEPMMNADHLMMSSGGGGVLHQLLGPLPSSSSSSTSNQHSSVAANPPLSSPAAAVAAATSVVAAAAATANIAAPIQSAAVANMPTGSKLCEKNKMLASLLAKTPVIPSHSLSTSIASPKPSALPQEKLPKDLKEKILQTPPVSGTSAPGAHWAGGSVQTQPTTTMQLPPHPPMQQPQQQHLLNQQQQQQQQRHPAMQQSQQHQLHPRSQHPQQQHQQHLNLSQKQQQQAPQTGGFLNSLLNRPIDSAAGPNLGDSQQQSNQQQLYLAAQQPPPQLQQHRSNQNPVQKLSLNNQQQLSAAMNSSGGFNISLHPQQQQQQQQQQHHHHHQPQHQLQHSGSMGGGAGQRSGMAIQPQQASHSNAMLAATSLESSDGTYSVHADFMTPLDVQMTSAAGWGDNPSMDPELSDIIEQVIDMNHEYESDSMIFGELTSATPPPIQPVMSVQLSQSVTSVTQATAVVGSSGPLLQMDMSKEKLAITAIQKSLMSYEKISPVAQSPPAYNLPGYAQQGQGAPMRMSTPSYAMNSPSAQPGLANQQQTNLTMPVGRKQKLPVQQRRLLNRQQQQQQQQQQQEQQQHPPQQQQLLGVLLNESSVQHTQGPQLSPGALQIMDDLLNAIPPNMTISRSDSQVSPNYGSVMLSSPLGSGPLASQISPSQRPMQPPFSPHGPMTTANGGNYNQSPQAQIVNNNSGNNFAPGGPSSRLSPFNSTQVSPRVSQSQQGFQQQQQHGAQLSPQPGVGARSSPGISLQGQPSPGVGVGPWNNNMANRPNLQPQRQQQQQQQQAPQQQTQQQHLLGYGQGIRGYAPRPMRTLPNSGPTNCVGPAGPGNSNNIRQGYGNNGMADNPTGPSSSNGMFARQQQQQQQQQQLRLQRTVSAPSGVIPALSIGGGLSHNASSCGTNTASIRQTCREDTSSLHSTTPSALIHHHPPPSSNPSTSSSSSSYPSNLPNCHPSSPSGYHLGMANTGQSYQQQSGGGGGCGNRGSASSAAAASVYSAKVLAYQQGSNRQAAPTSMGLSSGNSQLSRPPSADDSTDSFFHFDSISSHQPYQHPHHLSFPPQGPLHSSELQLAGTVGGPVQQSGGRNDGGGGPAMASEYVRKELKAVVGARTIQRGLSGPVGNVNQALSSGPMNHSSPPMMVPGGKPLNQADLEALGLSYELPQGNDGLHGRVWDSPNMGESPSQTMPSTRNTMEEAPRPADPQMSLLKQLLSE